MTHVISANSAPFESSLEACGVCRTRLSSNLDGNVVLHRQNGEDRIRTYEALASLTVFETAAFDHSATSPRRTG
jgi:hypothetical protein